MRGKQTVALRDAKDLMLYGYEPWLGTTGSRGRAGSSEEAYYVKREYNSHTRGFSRKEATDARVVTPEGECIKLTLADGGTGYQLLHFPTPVDGFSNNHRRMEAMADGR